MQLYSKEGLLILVQADHLTGEQAGDAVGCFYEAGAKNVQVISAITKKNRPSYLFLIDAAPEDVQEIETLIVRELGSAGWHRIETCHRHTDVTVIEKQARILAGSETYFFLIRGKVTGGDPDSVRPEYEDCAALKDLLAQKAGLHISLMQVQREAARLLRGEILQMHFTGADDAGVSSVSADRL